jgi:hypothetical protein
MTIPTTPGLYRDGDGDYWLLEENGDWRCYVFKADYSTHGDQHWGSLREVEDTLKPVLTEPKFKVGDEVVISERVRTVVTKVLTNTRYVTGANGVIFSEEDLSPAPPKKYAKISEEDAKKLRSILAGTSGTYLIDRLEFEEES